MDGSEAAFIWRWVYVLKGNHLLHHNNFRTSWGLQTTRGRYELSCFTWLHVFKPQAHKLPVYFWTPCSGCQSESTWSSGRKANVWLFDQTKQDNLKTFTDVTIFRKPEPSSHRSITDHHERPKTAPQVTKETRKPNLCGSVRMYVHQVGVAKDSWPHVTSNSHRLTLRLQTDL